MLNLNVCVYTQKISILNSTNNHSLTKEYWIKQLNFYKTSCEEKLSIYSSRTREGRQQISLQIRKLNKIKNVLTKLQQM